MKTLTKPNQQSEENFLLEISKFLKDGLNVKECDESSPFSKQKPKLFTCEMSGINIKLIPSDKHNKETCIIIIHESVEKLRLTTKNLLTNKLIKKYKQMNFLLGSTRIEDKNIIFLAALKQTDTVYHGKNHYHIDSNEPIPIPNITIKRIF